MAGARNRRLTSKDSESAIHSLQVFGWIVERTIDAQYEPFASAKGLAHIINVVTGKALTSNVIDRAIHAGYPSRDTAKNPSTTVMVPPFFPKAFADAFGEARVVSRVYRGKTHTMEICPIAYTGAELTLIATNAFEWQHYPPVEALIPKGFVHQDLALALRGWASKGLAEALEAVGVDRGKFVGATVARAYESTKEATQKVLAETEHARKILANDQAKSPLGAAIQAFMGRNGLDEEQFCILTGMSLRTYKQVITGSQYLTERGLQRLSRGMLQHEPRWVESELRKLDPDIVRSAASRTITLTLDALIYERLEKKAKPQGVEISDLMLEALNSLDLDGKGAR